MTILDSSNLIFAIFGRAADSNTAAALAANDDKTAAINALLSSQGAGFQSNAEFVNAVYTNTMGAELAGSPLVALWTTLLDAGMMDKAQFVSQTMSFLDAVASVPAFADVPFVQTYQARSQVSLSTASNSGVLNASQLTAILQATTDAATANIALASANEAKAGAALSADVVKLAQVNIANLASKDASGFAAKLIEQSNAAAAQVGAPVIDAANPAAFVAQHGAEVASIAQAAGSTQAAASIAQATNEAKAGSGLEPASLANPAAPTTPANPEQGNTPAAPATPDAPATPATPATTNNAGGTGNAGGYVPSMAPSSEASGVSAYNNVATFTSGAGEIDLKGGAVAYNGSAFKIENGALNINEVSGALSIKDSSTSKLSNANVNAFIKTGGSLAKEAGAAAVNEKVAINAYLGGSASTNGTTSAGKEEVKIEAENALKDATNIYAFTTGKITVAKLASLNNKAIDASKVNANIEITEALSGAENKVDLNSYVSSANASDKLAVTVANAVKNITGTAGSDTITFEAGADGPIDLSGSKATNVEKVVIKANANTTSIKALPGVDNEIIVGNPDRTLNDKSPFTVELDGNNDTNDIVNVKAATLQANNAIRERWEIKNLKAGDKIDFGQTGVSTKIEKAMIGIGLNFDGSAPSVQQVLNLVKNIEDTPNAIYHVTIDGLGAGSMAGTYLAYNKSADGKLTAGEDILVFLGNVNLDFTTSEAGLVTAAQAAQ